MLSIPYGCLKPIKRYMILQRCCVIDGMQYVCQNVLLWCRRRKRRCLYPSWIIGPHKIKTYHTQLTTTQLLCSSERFGERSPRKIGRIWELWMGVSGKEHYFCFLKMERHHMHRIYFSSVCRLLKLPFCFIVYFI